MGTILHQYKKKVGDLFQDIQTLSTDVQFELVLLIDVELQSWKAKHDIKPVISILPVGEPVSVQELSEEVAIPEEQAEQHSLVIEQHDNETVTFLEQDAEHVGDGDASFQSGNDDGLVLREEEKQLPQDHEVLETGDDKHETAETSNIEGDHQNFIDLQSIPQSPEPSADEEHITFIKSDPVLMSNSMQVILPAKKRHRGRPPRSHYHTEVIRLRGEAVACGAIKEDEDVELDIQFEKLPQPVKLGRGRPPKRGSGKLFSVAPETFKLTTNTEDSAEFEGDQGGELTSSLQTDLNAEDKTIQLRSTEKQANSPKKHDKENYEELERVSTSKKIQKSAIIDFDIDAIESPRGRRSTRGQKPKRFDEDLETETKSPVKETSPEDKTSGRSTRTSKDDVEIVEEKRVRRGRKSVSKTELGSGDNTPASIRKSNKHKPDSRNTPKAAITWEEELGIKVEADEPMNSPVGKRAKRLPKRFNDMEISQKDDDALDDSVKTKDISKPTSQNLYSKNTSTSSETISGSQSLDIITPKRGRGRPKRKVSEIRDDETANTENVCASPVKRKKENPEETDITEKQDLETNIALSPANISPIKQDPGEESSLPSATEMIDLKQVIKELVDNSSEAIQLEVIPLDGNELGQTEDQPKTVTEPDPGAGGEGQIADIPGASVFSEQEETHEVPEEAMEPVVKIIEEPGKLTKLKIEPLKIGGSKRGRKPGSISLSSEPKKPRKPKGVGPKPSEKIKCEICGKEVRAVYMSTHMYIHTGEKPYQCTECGKSFRQLTSLYVHEKRHKGEMTYKCHYCEYASVTKIDVERHMNRAHLKLRPFMCDLCGKDYADDRLLRAHMKAHKGDKNVQCDQCDFKTHTIDIMRQHKKNIHQHKRSFECELCGAVLKYKDTWKNHMKSHFNERTHKCTICDATFINSSGLAAHKKTHEERRVGCPHCSKKFHNLAKLRRHMVVHTGEKAYGCNLCTYKCNLEDNLRKHLMKTHKIDLPSRKMMLTKYVTLPKMEMDAEETVVVYQQNETGDLSEAQDQDIKEVVQSLLMASSVVEQQTETTDDGQIMANPRYQIKLQDKEGQIITVEGTSSPAPLQIDTNSEAHDEDSIQVISGADVSSIDISETAPGQFELTETTIISSETAVVEEEEVKISDNSTYEQVTTPVAIVSDQYEEGQESIHYIEYEPPSDQQTEEYMSGKVIQMVAETEEYDIDEDEQATIQQIIQTLLQNNELAPGKNVPIHLGGDKVVDVMLAEDMQTVLIQKSHINTVMT